MVTVTNKESSSNFIVKFCLQQKVLLVDLGQMCYIPYDEAGHLPEILTSVPRQCVEIQLARIKPVSKPSKSKVYLATVTRIKLGHKGKRKINVLRTHELVHTDIVFITRSEEQK